MDSDLVKKILEERKVAKDFVNQQFPFQEKSLNDLEFKAKPLFLTGNIKLYENDLIYVVDSEVIFSTKFESISSRNVGSFPHANQGDLMKSLSESIWLLGNYMFSTWNQVHAAASKKYSGFLSICYKGTNFKRILPDETYRIRTKIEFPKEAPFYNSVLYKDNAIHSYIEGIGQTKELPLLK